MLMTGSRDTDAGDRALAPGVPALVSRPQPGSSRPPGSEMVSGAQLVSGPHAGNTYPPVLP